MLDAVLFVEYDWLIMSGEQLRQSTGTDGKVEKMPQSVGIIGYGEFGRLAKMLAERFMPGAIVRVYDPSPRHGAGEVELGSFEDVAQSDAVVLAVPISAYEQVLPKLVGVVRPDTVVIDIATVKTHTSDLLKRYAPNLSWISAHPMFGPNAYNNTGGDVRGFRVVLCDTTLPEESYAALKEMLVKCGFELIQMTPKEHDEHLARTLFLNHYLAQVLKTMNVGETPIDPPSFKALWQSVSMVMPDGALFADVYRYAREACEEVLREFESAAAQVHEQYLRGRK